LGCHSHTVAQPNTYCTIYLNFAFKAEDCLYKPWLASKLAIISKNWQMEVISGKQLAHFDQELPNKARIWQF